jgi:hypothetical protein
MRNIFNGLSKLFKSPTKKLHKELKRFEDGGPCPSIQKVHELINEGADVNALVKGYTALSICTILYNKLMFRAEPGRGVWIRNNGEVSAEQCRGFAQRYLDVAKVLVEAGADPRVSTMENSGYPQFNASMIYLTDTFGVQRDSFSLMKDFKDLLEAAQAAAEKREYDANPGFYDLLKYANEAIAENEQRAAKALIARHDANKPKTPPAHKN